MKKLLLSAFSLGLISFSASAQTVDYLVPASDLINMTVQTGDMCFDPSEYKQTAPGTIWGFQWMSTVGTTPTSVTVDWIAVSDEGLTIPTTLNAIPDANVAMNASSCAFVGQLFTMNTASYNPLGMNTVMLDYSASSISAQLLAPFPGAYVHIEVVYPMPCTDPDLPTLTATSPICPGGSTTINITGNLNDATDWEVYNSTCGTGADGSTTGSTYVVSPATTTTYFIRGEGGCVTPGSCSSITITVEDNTAPVPVVGSLSDITEECTSTPVAPDANDDCAGVVSATPDVTFPITIQGTTVVTWTYDDGNGNTSSQTQNVIIDDITAPVPDVGSLADVLAECSVTPTAPTAADNCVTGTITGTPDVTFPITTQGTTVVTWTYDDGNGNTSTQTQNVILDDVTPPAPDAGSLSDVTAECSATPSAPTATDNCTSGTITGTPDVTFPVTAQGTTVVTWTYDDGNGNTSTQTQNVILDDVTPPTPMSPGLSDVNDECSATPSTPLGIDACTGVTSGVPDVTFPITTQGTTVVTWTYDDGNGNTSTQTQNVNIIDVTAPTISSCPGDGTYPADNTGCTAQILWLTPIASDNCSGVTMTSTHNSGDTFPLGTTTVVYTATDVGGNTATCSFDITITSDLTASIASTNDIDCFGNMNGSIDLDVSGGGLPYAFDWNSGTYSTEDLSGLGVGAYDVTVTDAYGCTATANTSISEPTSALTAVVTSASDPTACGAADGAIDISVSGGTPTYTYNWNSGTFSTEDLTGLLAGAYDVVVTDANGCTVMLDSALSDPGAPTVSIVSFTDASCNGAMDGTIDIDVSGGTMPYAYDWNSGIFSTEDLSGLGAGNYSVVVTDGSGCSASISQVINEPAAIDVSVSQTGSTLSANASGLMYQWIDCATLTDIVGETNQTFVAMANGDYAVVVTDGSCSDTSACNTVEGLGLEEDLIGMKVFPNPTRDVLSIQLEGYTGSSIIRLMDISGKEVVMNQAVSFQLGSTVQLDLTTVERGTYLLRINYENNVQSQLIVIQ